MAVVPPWGNAIFHNGDLSFEPITPSEPVPEPVESEEGLSDDQLNRLGVEDVSPVEPPQAGTLPRNGDVSGGIHPVYTDYRTRLDGLADTAANPPYRYITETETDIELGVDVRVAGNVQAHSVFAGTIDAGIILHHGSPLETELTILRETVMHQTDSINELLARVLELEEKLNITEELPIDENDLL